MYMPRLCPALLIFVLSYGCMAMISLCVNLLVYFSVAGKVSGIMSGNGASFVTALGQVVPGYLTAIPA